MANFVLLTVCVFGIFAFENMAIANWENGQCFPDCSECSDNCNYRNVTFCCDAQPLNCWENITVCNELTTVASYGSYGSCTWVTDADRTAYETDWYEACNAKRNPTTPAIRLTLNLSNISKTLFNRLKTKCSSKDEMYHCMKTCIDYEEGEWQAVKSDSKRIFRHEEFRFGCDWFRKCESNKLCFYLCGEEINSDFISDKFRSMDPSSESCETINGQKPVIKGDGTQSGDEVFKQEDPITYDDFMNAYVVIDRRNGASILGGQIEVLVSCFLATIALVLLF